MAVDMADDGLNDAEEVVEEAVVDEDAMEAGELAVGLAGMLGWLRHGGFFN